MHHLPWKPLPRPILGAGIAVITAAIVWAAMGAPGAPAWMLPRAGHEHEHDGHGTMVMMPSVWYEPRALTIAPGTKVTWMNTDAVAHTVTSENGTFDSGLIQPGDAWSFTFAAPGEHRYFCVPHSTVEPEGRVGQVGAVTVT